ncbi:MAG: macro domain-containing protein [Alphaproteobacteria bacterium]|jgi:O-acetyl-ADP-ribose deacetylase (regulator of RNase III)|nr:macro domain-containing protein [Alphaproteobacteria bacterium]
MSGRLSVLAADITTLGVDAIVNAANESLWPGGGVDGAIRRAAGPRLTDATRKLRHCPTGEACLTEGFDLPANWVIHTVGPRWRDGNRGEPEALANCYRNSLALAAENAIRSIAFPAISTGIYGFPAERAAAIAVRELSAGLDRHPDIVSVLMISFGDRDHAILSDALDAAERERP